MSKKYVATYLIGLVNKIYKNAVQAAKREGNTTTMYKEGAKKVIEALNIQDEMALGENPGGVMFAEVPYTHRKTVEKVEKGRTLYTEIVTNCLLRSEQRDGRCILSVLACGTDEAHKIAEVSRSK